MKTYSEKQKAQRARIKRLPKLVDECVFSITKSGAKKMIENFKTGISQRKFNLEPLKPSTIKAKISQGLKKPKTELYGKGLDDPRSLVNGLEIFKKEKKGWAVRASAKKHYSGDITIKRLLNVHEYGCTIKKKNGTVIKIPPRQAFHKAFAMTMRQLRNYESEKNEVRKAINLYIRTGKEEGFKKITARLKNG